MNRMEGTGITHSMVVVGALFDCDRIVTVDDRKAKYGLTIYYIVSGRHSVIGGCNRQTYT